MGHENKCAHLHGHNYIAYFTASAELDKIGRVIDFSVLKDKIGGWIDRYWDHGFILSRDDAAGSAALEAFRNHVGGKPQKRYWLPYNPTAENMARFLLGTVCPQVLRGTGVLVVRVRLEETENCSAVAELEGTITVPTYEETEDVEFDPRCHIQGHRCETTA